MVLPVILRSVRGHRDRARRIVLAGLVCIGIALPWIAFNFTRFREPVYLSTNFDYTVGTTNSAGTWYGDRIGFWDPSCNAAQLEDADVEFPRSTGLSAEPSIAAPVWTTWATTWIGFRSSSAPDWRGP